MLERETVQMKRPQITRTGIESLYFCFFLKHLHFRKTSKNVSIIIGFPFWYQRLSEISEYRILAKSTNAGGASFWRTETSI